MSKKIIGIGTKVMPKAKINDKKGFVLSLNQARYIYETGDFLDNKEHVSKVKKITNENGSFYAHLENCMVLNYEDVIIL